MSVRVISGVSIGDVPKTPATPFTDKPTPVADGSLIEQAIKLGQPFGYLQEQGGRLIQNIVPVHKLEFDQISSSSKVELEMHTETAFHPYMPNYVLLLCMRGDITAETTYSLLEDILENLDESVISTLKTDMFYMGIDQSFRTESEPEVFIRRQILSDDEQRLVYDSVLMTPMTEDASIALSAVSSAIQKTKRSIVLNDGDLLIIDNYRTVHGRKPFQPRYDGTDRWLKRCLVLDGFPPKSEYEGRVITTKLEKFGMSELELKQASVAQLDRAEHF